MANKELKTKIVLRNDEAAKWSTTNPVLLKGEIGIESDTLKIKIGDGVKKWSELSYFMGNIQEVLKNYIPKSEKGIANGIATLGSDGKVPVAQLPSYVDDVLEGYYNEGKFYKEDTNKTIITGEQGKIYVDLDSNATYRWSGSAFIKVSNPIDYASQAEAEAGADNTKVMTSLRTKQAIEKAGQNYEPKIAHKGTAFNKDFGTGAGQVVEGDDVRLSDARTPKGNAGGDLMGTYPNPTIKEGAVTDNKIAENALNVQKLFIARGDVLILNGGTAVE